MVVPGHHVLGAKVQERPDCGAVRCSNEGPIALRDVMRMRKLRHGQQKGQTKQRQGDAGGQVEPAGLGLDRSVGAMPPGLAI